MALLVVLWTILLLTTITAVASSAAHSSADVAAARRAGSIARAMAESGIAAATARVDAILRLPPRDSLARFAALAGLEPAARRGLALASDTIGDGTFAVTVVDVSARLDVNEAGVDGWHRLLRNWTNDADARRIAVAIDARVRGEEGRGTNELRGDSRTLREQERSRDSLVAALLGRSTEPLRRRPFESLDDLLEVPGIEPALLERAAPFLTVDGNGTVNREAAPREVLDAAAGSHVEHPVRLLLISRGWMVGHPLTREIEAVYDIADDGLRLVRWRERDR